MTQYKHVLLAADLIPKDDDAAADKALEIAKSHNAELSLVHIVEFVYTYGPFFGDADSSYWQDELIKKAKEEMTNLAKKLNVPAERCHLLTGQPKQLILDIAETNQVDLIVMGSHAKHGVELFLLGSTANGVLQHANCDVLAVRVQNTAETASERKATAKTEAPLATV